MASMELSNFTQAQTFVFRPNAACIPSQLALSALPPSAPDPPFLSAPPRMPLPCPMMRRPAVHSAFTHKQSLPVQLLTLA